jgi:hypothetical protein
MLIGYYPGGGGNRYYQYSLGRDFDQPDVAYDSLVMLPCRGKYLNASGELKNQTYDTILLHCVNYDRIHQETGRSDIVIIKSNLKDSLRREWSIKGKYKPMFFPEEVSDEAFLIELYDSIKDPTWPEITNFTEYKKLPNQIYQEVEVEFSKNKALTSNTSTHNFLTVAYTAISWHHNFYSKYPLDPGPTKLIDVDQDDSDFARVMRHELDLYKDNKLFNFAWDVYTALGGDAPIITLFQESSLANE